MLEVILRPTDKIVQLVGVAAEIPVRIWQGKTSTGIPVYAYITRIGVEADRPEHEHNVFREALKGTETPTPAVASLDMRLNL
jgi:hypothetical protein